MQALRTFATFGLLPAPPLPPASNSRTPNAAAVGAQDAGICQVDGHIRPAAATAGECGSDPAKCGAGPVASTGVADL